MAKISALRSAVRSEVTGSKKSDPRTIVASDLRDFNSPNTILYSQAEIIKAINGYAEGDRMTKQGEALKTLHREPVETFGLNNTAYRWAEMGSLPENPKLVTDSSGKGTIISFMLTDREMKLDEVQFSSLANLIGAEEASDNTIKRDEIAFDPEKLNTEVVESDNQTVIEIVDEAISNAFERLGRTDLLEGLFVIKERFTTKKGLLPKGLALVRDGKDSPQKLTEFVRASRTVISLRPGNVGE